MSSTMVRISRSSSDVLRDLAAQTGESMQAVLDKAIDAYRRQRMFDELDAAYTALRADPEAWQSELQERAAWDTTLTDGLDPTERWTDDGREASGA